MSKAFKRSIKNVVSGYTSAQVSVRNATSNEAYGPSTGQLEELADLTYEHSEFLDIMDMIDKRLNDKGKNWRHVAKALTVLDFLVRCGSENVVRWSRDNLYIIKTLREFQYVDEDGHDQGSIIRVKAKELTSLLRDDERLTMERELRTANRRNGRFGNRGNRNSDDETEEERAMREALEESKRTAEDDERRRRNATDDDDGLEQALRLSREEEEARRLKLQNGNLLDLNDAPQVGVQYDIWGNPIYPGQQDAYLLQQQQQQALLAQQQMEAQQQAYMQQLQQQALLEQQQQEYLQQQYLQQQYLQQQQQQQQYLQQQQQLYAQQQLPLQTGSNNPFAMNSQPEPEPLPVQQQPEPQQQQQPLARIPTGSQKKNEQFSELNQLLAQGTGIDTFGNEGATRIPAQYTKTSQFLNSSGTGIGQTQHSIGNPFLKQQYTGVASTGIVPAQTGYGFGNQGTSQASSSRGNDQSLIDI